jgi:hypothetical protein
MEYGGLIQSTRTIKRVETSLIALITASIYIQNILFLEDEP